MAEALPFILSGLVLGLAASLAPGPMLTLVISETLRHNKIEGIKVAVSPLVTDVIIVPISLVILSQLARIDTILGLITLLGAAFVAYLGYESLTTKGLKIDLTNVNPQSLKRGVITNTLNPHPYLFWLTVGGPLTLKAYEINLATAIIFVASFYLFLIGTKILVAILVDKSKVFISPAIYLWLMRFLGGALLVSAIIFLKQAIELLQK